MINYEGNKRPVYLQTDGGQKITPSCTSDLISTSSQVQSAGVKDKHIVG
jgi:hypothetical protein